MQSTAHVVPADSQGVQPIQIPLLMSSLLTTSVCVHPFPALKSTAHALLADSQCVRTTFSWIQIHCSYLHRLCVPHQNPLLTSSLLTTREYVHFFPRMQSTGCESTPFFAPNPLPTPSLPTPSMCVPFPHMLFNF